MGMAAASVMHGIREAVSWSWVAEQSTEVCCGWLMACLLQGEGESDTHLWMQVCLLLLCWLEVALGRSSSAWASKHGNMWKRVVAFQTDVSKLKVRRLVCLQLL